MPSRIALLSDVHANLEALEAVLRDLEAQKVDRLVVLGDSVNYGPDPRACLERLTAEADVLLVGNHEKEVAFPEPYELEGDAREMAEWTARTLEGLPAWEKLRKRIGERGAEALASVREGDVRFVHASPERPVVQYVWPGYRTHYLIYNAQLDQHLSQILDGLDVHHGFCGHTHVPALLVPYEGRELFGVSRDWNRKFTFIGPNIVFYVPDGAIHIEGLSAHKILCNPGSVGQPRDHNPLAAYAIYDGDSIEFRRVLYAVRTTQAKLRTLPLSDSTRNFFADRLAKGE
jgi:predicted phosphodiesterase